MSIFQWRLGGFSQKICIFIPLSWAFCANGKYSGLTSGQNDDPVSRTWKMTHQMTHGPGDPMTQFHVRLPSACLSRQQLMGKVLSSLHSSSVETWNRDARTRSNWTRVEARGWRETTVFYWTCLWIGAKLSVDLSPKVTRSEQRVVTRFKPRTQFLRVTFYWMPCCTLK